MLEKEALEKNDDKQKKPSNKKPIRNTFILLGIYFLTICITFYFCKNYSVYKEYQKEIPVIRGSLLEINSDDLEHYIIDNPSVIIYMCTSHDDQCRNFEKNLKKYVERMEITNEIIYLNLSGVDTSQFINNFNNKYHLKTKLADSFPAFAYFEDGKLEALLQSKTNKKLTISKAKNFLELILNDEETENNN